MRWLIFLLLLVPVTVIAQPGIDEMQQARQSLDESFFSATDCAYVLAGLFGIIGALRIYYNWQMGHERVTLEVAAWLFSAFFMVLAGAFLRALFGL